MNQSDNGWNVDSSTMTATHECGLVIQYRPSDDGDGLVGFILEGKEAAQGIYDERELESLFEESGYAMIAALYADQPPTQRLH